MERDCARSIGAGGGARLLDRRYGRLGQLHAHPFTVTKSAAHKWDFAPRFRRNTFGWRSQPAIQRVREAVTEIRAVARKDPVLAAAGAVLFLEKVSPALEQVDSSSGAIGTAVNNAIEALVLIIAEAPVDDGTRDQWLERLWDAHQNDAIPCIECLAEYWGELCVSPERAGRWADLLVDGLRTSWRPDRRPGDYFNGTTACLSALLHAGRHDELLALLDRAPHPLWHDRKWGVKALVAAGRKAEAIRYAEDRRSRNDNPAVIARACEEILLGSGLADEAYARYAIDANQGSTFLATYRSIAKKYPQKTASAILTDLVASTPGQEGKWFTAAKDAGLFDEAIALAARTACDPRTLTRAARDFAATRPGFAIECGLSALRWIASGHGYEITGADILTAYEITLSAGATAGNLADVRARIDRLLADPSATSRDLVRRVIGRAVGTA
jgi:hypothetical protein